MDSIERSRWFLGLGSDRKNCMREVAIITPEHIISTFTSWTAPNSGSILSSRLKSPIIKPITHITISTRKKIPTRMIEEAVLFILFSSWHGWSHFDYNIRSQCFQSYFLSPVLSMLTLTATVEDLIDSGYSYIIENQKLMYDFLDSMQFLTGFFKDSGFNESKKAL